ncbi:MAG: hypothetical protein IKY71_03845 [Bacteroidaceae bacterium]|nr:hypothetical protein [Bacteroidaceae bacterium]
MRLIDKIRFILNIFFLVATAATFFLWMTDSSLFFHAGIIALSTKFFEFILRFIN